MTSDNDLPVDFKITREPSFRGRFVVSTFQGTPLNARLPNASYASRQAGENGAKFDIQDGCIKRTRTTIINITHYETYIQLSKARSHNNEHII